MDHWGILSMVDILRGVVKRSGGPGKELGKKPKNIVSVFEMINSKLDSEIMLLQEKRKIGRWMSCGRRDKSCYMTDNGRGDVERELRLWWLRACRGVLRPPSIHPAPCWTRARGQGGVAAPHVRFSVSLDERRRKQEDLISWLLVFERNARVLLCFSCTEAGFHYQFLPIVLWKRKIAITFVALWCDRWDCQGLEGCLWF